MKKFKKPSLEEFKELVQRLQGKTVEGMMAMFGPPVGDSGPRTEERLADGVLWVVEIRRELMFRDIGPTIGRLVVTERTEPSSSSAHKGKRLLIVDEHATSQSDAHEPPSRASASMLRIFQTLDSLPEPVSGGGR